MEKNKHPNYGEHIHLFSGIVKCPDCGGILSSTITYKHSGKPNKREYYHLTCKNSSCKSKGLHYNSNKIEKKLSRMLDELVRYIYDTDNEIIVANTNRTKELKDLDKAIDKLKLQEKRLVDLYINSTLDVETINTKNNVIKKEIEKLSKLNSNAIRANRNTDISSPNAKDTILMALEPCLCNKLCNV